MKRTERVTETERQRAKQEEENRQTNMHGQRVSEHVAS